MSLAKQVVEGSSSFDWRGPYHSLTWVENDSVQVIRSRSDWTNVVGAKQVNDMRNNNLADLFPRPRDVLARLMGGLNDSGNGSAPMKANGPGL